MPLVIVTGLPCSGKTRFSEALKSFVETAYPTTKILVINDESLHLSKQNGYSTVPEEKRARATFMSAIERSISKDVLVIADSLNYIKGYRYQLYCIARATNTPHCCAYVLSSAERASENIQQRDLGYPKETFDELVERYEEPIGTNKWDSPLFNIDPATDMTESFEQICRALLTEKAKKPPSFATSAKLADASGLVTSLDRVTQEIIEQIQQQMKPFGPSSITIKEIPEPLELVKPVPSGTLFSIRRQFMHMNRLHPIKAEDIPALFTNYIKSAI